MRSLLSFLVNQEAASNLRHFHAPSPGWVKNQGTENSWSPCFWRFCVDDEYWGASPALTCSGQERMDSCTWRGAGEAPVNAEPSVGGRNLLRL